MNSKPVKRYNSFGRLIEDGAVVAPYRLDWTGVAPPEEVNRKTRPKEPKPVKRYNSFGTLIGAEEVVAPFRFDWTGVAPPGEVNCKTQPKEPKPAKRYNSFGTLIIAEEVVAPSKPEIRSFSAYFKGDWKDAAPPGEVKRKTQPKKPKIIIKGTTKVTLNKPPMSINRTEKDLKVLYTRVPQPTEREDIVQESFAPTKSKLKTNLKCKTEPKKRSPKPKKHKMAKKKAAVPIIKKPPLPRVKAAVRSIRRSREAVPATEKTWIPRWLWL